MPRDEILKQAFIYGRVPLYGLTGATTMGGVAAQDQ
jgi:hypothetical protein